MSRLRSLAGLLTVAAGGYLLSTPPSNLRAFYEAHRPRLPRSADAMIAAAAPAAKSEPARVTSEDRANDDPWVGVLLSPTVEISARGDAKILKIHARVGDVVKSGDVLAELDVTNYKLELAAAEASVRASNAEAWQASVSLAHARDRQARRGQVVKYGSVEVPLVSGEELAGAKYDSLSARGRVSAAAATSQERQARVEQLRLMIQEATLRATFDGVIASRYLEPGVLVRGGQPILRLVSRGALRARFAVPESDVTKIRLGSPVAVEWDDRQLGAVVDRVAPEVDPASSTLFVEAVVETPGNSAGDVPRGRVVKVRSRMRRAG